jgi:8-hydroxy-5-deazaflavin:NADPH oxidoreductase
MATIGILGTGRMGIRLALLFADLGHQVILGSRERDRAVQVLQNLNRTDIQSGSYQSTADAEVVLPAMFLRDGALEILEPLRDQLDSKLYIDITNPFNSDYTDFILPWNTSGAEQVQHRFPRARVVGAFKNVWWEVFDAPQFENTVSDVFVVGNDATAKADFFKLVEGSPFRYIDAGKLSNARIVERMTLLSGELGQRYGYFPRMNYKLLGEPWTSGQANQVSITAAGTTLQSPTSEP